MMDYGQSSPTLPPPPQDSPDTFDMTSFIAPKRQVKRRPIPKLDDIIKEVARERQLVQLRNDTIQAGRDVVNLSTIAAKMSRARQSNSNKDDFIMRLSWPATVLQESVNTIGRVKTYLSMEATENTEEAEEAAEKPIALLNRLDETLEDEFSLNGGQQPLIMAAAQYAFRDGVLAQKMCRRPAKDDKDGEIWDYELVDILELVPVYVGKQYVRCYRIVLLTVADIRAQWGDNLLPDLQPEDEREVIAYYDDYWHAVYCSDTDGEWLKKPVPHEYDWGIPIQITYFRGMTGSRGDGNGSLSAEQVMANRGVGMFSAVVDELKERARLQTALNDRLMLATRPPVTVTSESGDAGDVVINRNANGVTRLKEGEKVDLFPQNMGDQQYITLISQAINGALEDATLPLNSMARFQSGFERGVAEKQAASFFEPYLRGLKIALRWRYRAALLLFRQFGDQVEVSGQSARGKPFTWTLTPDLIPANPRVIVNFSSINQIDKVQMTGAIAQLVASDAMDYLTAYGPDYLNLENPHLVIERIREQQIWKNPQAQAALVPALTIGALEKQLKDAKSRGHELMAKVLEKQIKDLFVQIMSPPPVTPPPPAMGAGGPPMGQSGPGMPPQGGPPPELLAMMAQMGGPQGPPSPSQGPMPPMPAAQQLPPDLMSGGATQLSPEVLAQRLAGRVPPGMGQG